MRDPHQEFFDKAASEWDIKFTADDLERLSHLVDSLGITEGMDVLDVGCGTGILFDSLRRKVGGSGSVTGADLSMQMARAARRNFPFENINVIEADVSNLPFVDFAYDMAISFSAFAHFVDKQKALRELSRVLKPQARLYIIHLQSSKDLAELHKKIGGAVEHDRIPQEDIMREMLAAGQFDDVTIEDHTGLYLASAVNTK
ncbi:MAG: hypothetical protein DRP45_12210 [Candidatus Zixiibacteriota bacterium]|nr:MAG: hypothetical protein DRP45_12210 [candidate division Zixibacteria bacterium]